MYCIAREEMAIDVERVLFYNVRKIHKMLDVGCVTPEEMP